MYQPNPNFREPQSPNPSFRNHKLFTNSVNGIFLVFADALDEVGVGEKFKLKRKRPGLGIGLRVVNRDFDVHMSKVAAAEALDGVKSFRMRTAAVIDPALIVEAARVNHEPVALPFANGITEPRGSGHRRMGAAVCEDLAVERVLFIQNEGYAGILHDFE